MNVFKGISLRVNSIKYMQNPLESSRIVLSIKQYEKSVRRKNTSELKKMITETVIYNDS